MKKIAKKILNVTTIGLVAVGMSVTSGASTVSADHVPVCGPMDVVLVIDDTGSMGPAIGNVQTGAASIVTDVEHASGGDYRMGLVTFKDTVSVPVDLAAGNSAAMLVGIAGLAAGAGAAEPEASDEALNVVVNGTGAFTTGNFRAGATKIIVLVTDARPGGFDDAYVAGVDDVNAHQMALDAAAFAPAPPILISALYTETSGIFSATIEPIMMDYASTTGGTYAKLPADGSGTAAAISDIIKDCGGHDATPPTAQCVATVNPAGKKVPTAPAKGGQGQNQDGYYEVSAKDDVDLNPTIHVVDRGADDLFPSLDDFEFVGPFANPTKVKYTEANGATPSQMPGAGVITWKLKGQGDMVVYAVDAAGNVSDPAYCLVPNPPK